MRGGRLSNVLLETVLRDSLKRINRIQHKGDSYLFSEENLQTAIQRLKNVKYDGLLKTNEAVYDLLTLGVALEQSVEGAVRRATSRSTTSTGSTRRTTSFTSPRSFRWTAAQPRDGAPDLVLFVNGIPLAVIECKSPNTEVAQAVSQMLRNQRDDEIPAPFAYAQLLLALSKNHCNTPRSVRGKYWAVWNEEGAGKPDEEARGARARQPLPPDAKAGLYEAGARHGSRCGVASSTPNIWSVLPPRRTGRFSPGAPGPSARITGYYGFRWRPKKIARYQQYFAIRGHPR